MIGKSDRPYSETERRIPILRPPSHQSGFLECEVALHLVAQSQFVGVLAHLAARKAVSGLPSGSVDGETSGDPNWSKVEANRNYGDCSDSAPVYDATRLPTLSKGF